MREVSCSKYPKYLSSGMVFNCLTVINLDKQSKFINGKMIPPSSWKYTCECVCGNIVTLSKNTICRGHVKSCGCLAIKKTKEANKKKNKIITLEDSILIVSSNDSQKKIVIDKEDYSKVKDYCWHTTDRDYVCAPINKKITRIHRFILDYSGNLVIDHIDGSPLNNKKENLRICNSKENNRNHKIQSNNTSGATGVTWHCRNNKCLPFIVLNKKQYHLGYFSSFSKAVETRKLAEKRYHEEFSASVCRNEY